MKKSEGPFLYSKVWVVRHYRERENMFICNAVLNAV
jgi:hypothetical protein